MLRNNRCIIKSSMIVDANACTYWYSAWTVGNAKAGFFLTDGALQFKVPARCSMRVCRWRSRKSFEDGVRSIAEAELRALCERRAKCDCDIAFQREKRKWVEAKERQPSRVGVAKRSPELRAAIASFCSEMHEEDAPRLRERVASWEVRKRPGRTCHPSFRPTETPPSVRILVWRESVAENIGVSTAQNGFGR